MSIDCKGVALQFCFSNFEFEWERFASKSFMKEPVCVTVYVFPKKQGFASKSFQQKPV